MTEHLTFTEADVLPERAAALELQGIPAGCEVSGAIADLYDTAVELCGASAEPCGVLEQVDTDEFDLVYEGDGRNDSSSPLADIYPRADRLALFAVSLGPRISREIAARFESNDVAVAYMLDSVASVVADHLAEVVRHRFLARCATENASDVQALHYSPGYCGWHISGQRALFERLHPEAIGITLNDSFLMEPMKSVSGVVVVGPGAIHNFDASYDCCSGCQTRGCRERIEALDLA